MNSNQAMDVTKEDINQVGKREFESSLIEAALSSATKNGDINNTNQKKYAALKENAKNHKTPQAREDKILTKGAVSKKEMDWEIGFTPHNFENLVFLSGLSSNIAFYTKYGISKTVFYSYMRGDTSPAYKDWKVLVDSVLADPESTQLENNKIDNNNI